MPGQHKHRPISVRLGPVRDRLLGYTSRTGLAVNAVIRDAVSEFLDRHDQGDERTKENGR